ncbi:MAG TPA: histidinol-phosphatase [Acidimicrobiales bacterium]|nr:histidinol-phosphatase [Acidimicrobiales bacterium]
MIDYHVHLWPHPERADSRQYRLEALAAYCERAAEEGVGEIALTEHLFRFERAQELLGPFWEAEPRVGLREAMAGYWEHHATEDLDRYVESVLEAKAAGLPVVLGLEVDYYTDRMGEVAALLAGYPFDVLLGSVHWLGTWMFDVLGEPVQMDEWDARGTEAAWRDYTTALEELAATRTCDVLAHPDLIKLVGRYPDGGLLAECEERMAEAASGSGMAAEISSAGWGKPVGEQYPSTSLLDRFHRRGVPVTTASDSHGPKRVAARNGELRALASAAGYTSLCAFSARRPREVPLGSP